MKRSRPKSVLAKVAALRAEMSWAAHATTLSALTPFVVKKTFAAGAVHTRVLANRAAALGRKFRGRLVLRGAGSTGIRAWLAHLDSS